MIEEREYILGTDREELDRLRFQHQAWLKQAYALWRRAGLRGGDVVLDLGCGPGYTSFELARIVGPEGRVIARDISRRFVDFVAAEGERLGFANVEPSLGPVEELELPVGSLDAAYARWLLCWLPDPTPALACAGRSLRPGGVVVLQDYLDWGAMKLLPSSDVFDRSVAACMRSWAEGGSDIDVGARLPELAATCDLRVAHFEPVARVGRVGSLEWRWLGGFFTSYLPRLVERGLLTRDELEAHRSEWDARTADGRSRILAPTMVDVVLEKQ
jgi:SAM-dependent methyltransferase